METLLVRHAIAFRRDSARWADDRTRPLSPEGIRRFRKTAASIVSLAGAPERVLTSPLLRTRQTADLLTEIARWPEAIDCRALAPGHTSEDALAALREHRSTRTALIGHEPNLSDLLAFLVAGSGTCLSIDFRKGAVVCICFAASVSAGSGTLRWVVTPRTLRAMRR